MNGSLCEALQIHKGAEKRNESEVHLPFQTFTLLYADKKTVRQHSPAARVTKCMQGLRGGLGVCARLCFFLCPETGNLDSQPSGFRER